MKAQKKPIGRRVRVNIPQFHIYDTLAKVDTGAFSSSVHYENLKKTRNGIKVRFFEDSEYIEFKDFFLTIVKSSNAIAQERFTVRSTIQLLDEEIETNFTLTNRRGMKLPILLGRELLHGKFIVDVDYSATSPNPEYKL